MNDFLFHAGLANQAEASLGEVAHATMKQAAGAAAGAESEIVLFDEGDAESAHGGVARDAGSDDPAANHQQVKRFFT
jgi:hypothetical protein